MHPALDCVTPLPSLAGGIRFGNMHVVHAFPGVSSIQHAAPAIGL